MALFLDLPALPHGKLESSRDTENRTQDHGLINTNEWLKWHFLSQIQHEGRSSARGGLQSGLQIHSKFKQLKTAYIKCSTWILHTKILPELPAHVDWHWDQLVWFLGPPNKKHYATFLSHVFFPCGSKSPPASYDPLNESQEKKYFPGIYSN